MPSRYIREGMISSDRVDDLFLASPAAEAFYHRLLLVVDDFGRIEASPSLLRSKCYPKIADKVPSESIEEYLGRIVSVDLALMYEVDGKRFLEIFDPRRNPRAKESKWPAPEQDANKCLQVRADVRNRMQMSRYTIPYSVPVTFPVPVPCSVPFPENGGTAATSSDPIKSTATGASEPCEPPCDDLDKLAWSLASDLMAAHCKFSPGRLDTARSVIERILATAVNPKAVATAARESHHKYMIFWAKKRAENPRCFIPQLAKWFQEGDYLDPPDVAVATAAEGQPWKKIAAQIEGRRG